MPNGPWRVQALNPNGPWRVQVLNPNGPWRVLFPIGNQS